MFLSVAVRQQLMAIDNGLVLTITVMLIRFYQ